MTLFTNSTLSIFLSTPSGWRATFKSFYCSRFALCISIHALRVEGDPRNDTGVNPYEKFLSTPSGWRATTQHAKLGFEQLISIHALRVEGDTSQLKA